MGFNANAVHREPRKLRQDRRPEGTVHRLREKVGLAAGASGMIGLPTPTVTRLSPPLSRDPLPVTYHGQLAREARTAPLASTGLYESPDDPNLCRWDEYKRGVGHDRTPQRG